MDALQPTTSAALFFQADQVRSVPYEWFKRICDLYEELNLAPLLFTASSADGEDFLRDDCYILADEGGDIFKWGERIRARQRDLITALQNGRIESLALDVPRGDSVSRSEWRASADICLAEGEFYLGVAGRFESLPASLLRRAFGIMDGLFNIRYGIAYMMPLSEHPDSYAVGHRPINLKSAKDIIADLHARKLRPKTADEMWSQELSDRQRHLTGLFRAAYPANILSAAHVRSADLMAHRIGSLTRVNHSHWLWELSDAELPAAEKVLESQGVLVRQQTDT